MFTVLATFVTRRPWTVIATVALAALMALAGARHLHFVSDFDSSLPNRSPLSAQIHAIQNTFKSRNTCAVVWSSMPHSPPLICRNSMSLPRMRFTPG